MPLHQTMSGQKFDQDIKPLVQEFARRIANEELSINDALAMLHGKELDVFSTAALAKVIACFLCY